MSLPGSAIVQLSEENLSRKMKADEYIRDLESALERLKEKIDGLELANVTLRRRVESLEGCDVSSKEAKCSVTNKT